MKKGINGKLELVKALAENPIPFPLEAGRYEASKKAY